MDVLDTLKKMIVSELGNIREDQITPETRFKEDLGADSLDVVQIVMSIEDQFNIEVPEDALEGIKTVGQAVQAIEGTMKNI